MTEIKMCEFDSSDLHSDIVFDGNLSDLKGSFNSTIHTAIRKNEELIVKRVQNTFTHPNIVQEELNMIICNIPMSKYLVQYYSARLSDQLILAMEKCDKSLAYYLENQSFPIQPLEIMLQTMEALHFLHNNAKIVHGNIKPSNILFKNDVIKLSDFGLTHTYTELREQFIKNDILVRIFDWLAPEVLKCYANCNYKPVLTFKNDIFGAACIFYACMYPGMHPFGGTLDRAHNILHNISYMKTTNISLEEEQLLSVIRRMLSEKPSDRPVSAVLVAHFQELLSKSQTADVKNQQRQDDKIQDGNISRYGKIICNSQEDIFCPEPTFSMKFLHGYLLALAQFLRVYLLSMPLTRCTYSEVLEIMENSSSAPTVLKGWIKFATVLGTELVRVHKFQEQMHLCRWSEKDLITEILMDWRSRMGPEATLGSLLTLVEKQCKWTDVADSIRSLIKKKALAWDDLDERSKTEIYEFPVQFLGQTTTFLEISKVLGVTRMNEILQRFLKEDILKTMLSERPLNLDPTLREGKLPYYVSRTISIQRQLDPKIFKEKCSDVFLVQGIQRSYLSRLAKPEKTNLSGNQVDGITHRYILLECDNDYEILRKKTQAALHRIQYVNDNFFWISTMGSVDVIRKHLMGSAEKISEYEVVTQKLSIFNSRPIAIADCPGMGKTTLLSEIARQVAEHYPERYVLTISLPNLFSSMKSDRDQVSNLTFLKRSFAKSCANILLGQEILFELMNSERANFEVFLDAFDEISTSQIQLAKDMLEVLLHSNNLRAFITSRTYMREKLEQTVGVISWDIQPFSMKDQFNFFVRYWTNKFNLDDTTRVQEFTRAFLEYLQSHQIFCDENDVKDFVGIPINCFVLAELYSTDALRHQTSYLFHPNITFKFNTMCGMHQEFLAFRLHKIPDPQKAAVKQTLWVAAIQLLFPTCLDKLKELLTESLGSPIDTKLLLSVGILYTLDPPKFVHRTLAEFLVAEFIVSVIQRKPSESCGTKFVEFLVGSVLAPLISSLGVQLSERIIEDFASVLVSSTVWPQIDADCKILHVALGLEKYSKVNRMGKDKVGYLKHLLRTWIVENGNNAPYPKLINLLRSNTHWPPDVIDQLENIPSAKKFGYQHHAIVYFISALLDFKKENAYMGVLKILLQSDVYFSISFKRDRHDWASLLITSARHHVSLFKALCEYVESLYGKDLSQLDFGRLKSRNIPYTPLHAVVRHGNYPVVEYLLNKYGTDMLSASKELVYRTVFRSVKESPAVVCQKMDIIRLFVDINLDEIVNEPVLTNINEKLIYSAAVTAEGIHVRLFKCLIELGADTGENFNTESFVLGVLPYFTFEDMEEMVDFLTEKNLLGIMFRKDSTGICGLQQCIGFDNLRPETLQRIHQYHNFSIEDFDHSTFIGWVAKSKWQPVMMKSVMKIFNDVDLSDKNSCTLLIWAAWEKSLASIRYLIWSGANVNHVSVSNWSPLSATVYVHENDSCDPSLIHECIQVLLAAGADVDVIDSDGNTVFDKLESRNWKMNLQEETIDLLVKSSSCKYFYDKTGSIQKEIV